MKPCRVGLDIIYADRPKIPVGPEELAGYAEPALKISQMRLRDATRPCFEHEVATRVVLEQSRLLDSEKDLVSTCLVETFDSLADECFCDDRISGSSVISRRD